MYLAPEAERGWKYSAWGGGEQSLTLDRPSRESGWENQDSKILLGVFSQSGVNTTLSASFLLDPSCGSHLSQSCLTLKHKLDLQCCQTAVSCIILSASSAESPFLSSQGVGGERRKRDHQPKQNKIKKNPLLPWQWAWANSHTSAQVCFLLSFWQVLPKIQVLLLPF